MDGMSLLDVLRGVMLDPAEQAVYDADPGAYLGQYGYQDVDPADLSEAFGLVADTLPADQAMAAWTGESGPESPTLGDDTTDFDVGGPDDPSLGDPLAEAGELGGLDGSDDGSDDEDGDLDSGPGDLDDEPLSFGLGEQDEVEAPGLGDDPDAGDDLGLFGTAAPDDTGADDIDVTGFGDDLSDEGFDELVTGFDTPGIEPPDGDDGDQLDDTDDLAEIDGLGPLGGTGDDLDIGSF